MSDSQDRLTKIALFRYTLILPLLRGEYPPGGKQKLRKKIAAGHYQIPYSSRRTVSVSTLTRWERLYRLQGFDGLKPRPRSDRKRSRTISAETLDRAEALYWPYRTVPSSASSLIARLDPSSRYLNSTTPIRSPNPTSLPAPCAANSPSGVPPPSDCVPNNVPSPIAASSVFTLAICGKATPWMVPISLTRKSPTGTVKPFFLPFSTIALVSCLTLNSIGMSNCPGWKIVSSALSCATVSLWPSTSTRARSTPPSIWTPSVPLWASSVFLALPTTRKVAEKSSASFASCNPIFYQNSRALP